MKFRVIEKVIFNLMVTIICLDSATRCGSSFTSSSTNAMSAASTAISLPTPPIAIPTSAFFSAGASLMPSPIMHTGIPFFWYFSMYASLFSGIQFAFTSSIWSKDAIVFAAFSWSPVKRTGHIPSFKSSSIMCSLSLRTVSDNARKPAKVLFTDT